MASIETRNRPDSPQPGQHKDRNNIAEGSEDDETREEAEESRVADLTDQEEQQRRAESPDWAKLSGKKKAARVSSERTYMQFMAPYGDDSTKSPRNRAPTRRTPVKGRGGKKVDTSSAQAFASARKRSERRVSNASSRALSQPSETSEETSDMPKASSSREKKLNKVAKRGQSSRRVGEEDSTDAEETEDRSFTEQRSASDRKKGTKKRKQVDDEDGDEDGDGRSTESRAGEDGRLEGKADSGTTGHRSAGNSRKRMRVENDSQEKAGRGQVAYHHQDEAMPDAMDSDPCEAEEDAGQAQPKSDRQPSVKRNAPGDVPHQDSSQTLLEEPPRVDAGEARVSAQTSEALEAAADGKTAQEQEAAEKARQEQAAQAEAAKEDEYMRNRDVEVDDGVDPDRITEE